MRQLAKLFVAMAVLTDALVRQPAASWNVGVGIADITGPAAEVVMMGYANSDQRAAGIHMRIHSRAFIFEDPTTGKRVAFINIDTWSATEELVQGLESRLALELPGYDRHNFVIAGTHSHSTPGGYSSYFLFQFSTFGYVEQTTQAIIDGMVLSMKRADANIRPAQVLFGSANVDNSTIPGCPMPNCASINRSPTSYSHNPGEERAKYDGNTERKMDLLKIVDFATGKPIGVLNWFAVHPTSMGMTNHLISGDNKGYAEYLFEQSVNGNSSNNPSGRGPFVAAFAQSTAGDVSANINGTFCTGTGLPCNSSQSVCWVNGRPHNSQCLGVGPRTDMFQSMKTIGTRQYLTARHIFDSTTTPIGSGIDSVVRYVDLSNYWLQINGAWIKTCQPAMGTAFAAGTTDGPSNVDAFVQNSSHGDLFLQGIARMLAPPPPDQIECHAPKNILLYTAGLGTPYAYVPTTVALQLLRLGNVVVAAVPLELTTMAGRRTREALKKVLVQRGLIDKDGTVVINNCAGGYADYATTYEEYQHQRYEGASTAYGPYTHAAIQEILLEMALDLGNASVNSTKGIPPALTPKDTMWELQSKVIVDDPPIGGSFGDVYSDVRQGTFQPGDVVEAKFWGAHPRNDLRLEGSFTAVYWQNSTGGWNVVANDNDWETWFQWQRVGISASIVTVTWEVPVGCQSGNYSLGYHGDAKRQGIVFPISGYSRIFIVNCTIEM